MTLVNYKKEDNKGLPCHTTMSLLSHWACIHCSSGSSLEDRRIHSGWSYGYSRLHTPSSCSKRTVKCTRSYHKDSCPQDTGPGTAGRSGDRLHHSPSRNLSSSWAYTQTHTQTGCLNNVLNNKKLFETILILKAFPPKRRRELSDKFYLVL